jgi:hypothetical protein
MPDTKPAKHARELKKKGKPASTQAGEYVREEMHHVGESGRKAKSKRQAVAIGLSKARRAGIELPAPKAGTTSPETRRKAQQDLAAGRKQATKNKKRTKRG